MAQKTRKNNNMNTSAFLTIDEIQHLTGHRNRASQLDWLRHNGWIYLLNAKGIPVIGREYCNIRMSGGKKIEEYDVPPDFSKVNQPAKWVF